MRLIGGCSLSGACSWSTLRGRPLGGAPFATTGSSFWIAPLHFDHGLNALHIFFEFPRLTQIAPSLCLFHVGATVPFHSIQVVQKLFGGWNWHVALQSFKHRRLFESRTLSDFEPMSYHQL